MAHPLIILVLIGMVFKIISEIFLGMLCLIRVLPLLLLNFESTSREEPLNISLGESSRSIFIQLRGFYVFELIPLLIKITSFQRTVILMTLIHLYLLSLMTLI